MTAIKPTAPVARAAPLSPGQERLLAEAGAEPSAVTRSQPLPWLRPADTGAFAIEGPLEVERLRAAVAALITRQAALRTVVQLRPGAEPVQLVLARPGDDFEVETLSTGGEASLGAVSAAAVARKPGHDPLRDLFEVKLLRTAPLRHTLLLRVHHLISDGWSSAVLYRELSAFYKSALRGTPPDLPPLAVSFADHCVRIRRERRDGSFLSQLRYWLEELSGLAPVRGTTADPVAPVREIELRYPRSLAEGLARASRRATTPGGLAGPVLAALGSAIQRRTGETDVCVGTMISGRSGEGLENLIGNFVNVVPIRFPVGRAEAPADLLAPINSKLVSAAANQQIPIQDVIEALRRERGAETRLYHSTLALNSMRPDGLQLEGAEVEEVGVSPSGETTGPRLAPTKIGFRWLLIESPDGLQGTVSYNMNLVSEAQAVQHLQDFETALEAIANQRRPVAVEGGANGNAH